MGKGDDPNCHAAAAMSVGAQSGFEVWRSDGGSISYTGQQDGLICRFRDFEVHALGAIEPPENTDTRIGADNQIAHSALLVRLHLREGTLMDMDGATILRPGIYAMTAKTFERVADLGDFRSFRPQAFDHPHKLPDLPARLWRDLDNLERQTMLQLYWAYEDSEGSVTFEQIASHARGWDDMPRQERQLIRERMRGALTKLKADRLVHEDRGFWYLTSAGTHIITSPQKWQQTPTEYQRLLAQFDQADRVSHQQLTGAYNDGRDTPANSRQIEELMHELRGWGLVERPGQWEWQLTDQGRALLAGRPS